jgi:hypothetical protein
MAHPCYHFIGNKLDDCTENPIDVWMYRLSETLLPFMHTTGHTPNLVTTYSVVCKLVAVGSVWVGDWRTFVVTTVLAHLFDCMVRGTLPYLTKGNVPWLGWSVRPPLSNDQFVRGPIRSYLRSPVLCSIGLCGVDSLPAQGSCHTCYRACNLTGTPLSGTWLCATDFKHCTDRCSNER